MPKNSFKKTKKAPGKSAPPTRLKNKPRFDLLRIYKSTEQGLSASDISMFQSNPLSSENKLIQFLTCATQLYQYSIPRSDKTWVMGHTNLMLLAYIALKTRLHYFLSQGLSFPKI